MKLFTKRNALIGWIVLRIARRRLRQRLGIAGTGRGRRRGLLAAGAGLAAAATALAFYARRANGESAPAEAA
jgi:hypothetical protein